MTDTSADVPYLSDAWFAEAAELLAAHGPLPDLAGTSLAVETVVTDGPEGLRRYVVHFDESGARLAVDAAGDADVRITQPWSTAVAIARGELSAQSAFLAAEVQLGGDVSALIAHAGLVGRIGDLLGPLRRRTSYPPDAARGGAVDSLSECAEPPSPS